MEQLSIFNDIKEINIIDKVLYNGRHFVCPKCNCNLSETILRHIKFCSNCSFKLNWNIWDKEKNKLIKGVMK